MERRWKKETSETTCFRGVSEAVSLAWVLQLARDLCVVRKVPCPCLPFAFGHSQTQSVLFHKTRMIMNDWVQFCNSMAKSRQNVEHKRKIKKGQCWTAAGACHSWIQLESSKLPVNKYTLHSITVEQCNLFSVNGCERNALEFQRLGCTKYVSPNHIAGRTNYITLSNSTKAQAHTHTSPTHYGPLLAPPAAWCWLATVRCQAVGLWQGNMAFPAASTLNVNKVNKSHNTSIWYSWVHCFLLTLLRSDYHRVTDPITVNTKSRLSNVDTQQPCHVHFMHQCSTYLNILERADVRPMKRMQISCRTSLKNSSSSLQRKT